MLLAMPVYVAQCTINNRRDTWICGFSLMVPPNFYNSC
jgi:hypothetical protein